MTIHTVDEEAKDLGLHVHLCADRYAMLCRRLDAIEERCEKIEMILIELNQKLTVNQNTSLSRYLKWAGAAIFLLLGVVGFFLAHVFTKVV